MQVRIEKIRPDIPTPAKAHDSDYCYDCVAVSEEEIAPNVWKYGLGIKLQPVRPLIQRTRYDVCISIRPRSSIWKTGMVLSNSIGTIDEDYTGEISAVFYHVMPKMPRYKVGDKICQLHLDTGDYIQFWDDKLKDTERGAGGYGSTGR